MRKVALGVLSFLMLFLAMSTPSFSQVVISVGFGPPALPVYEQPICPGEGYIWTPGYWAWDDDDGDYYWVPGTWVLAPEVGYLWTPPWWGWEDGRFLFHGGYWGPHVGFYGGVVYGFGYFGEGFEGGRWDHDHFFYNRSVTNINVVNIHNVYNETVIHNNVTVNRVSYNGGPGGIQARPRAQDQIAERERHIGPAAAQSEHVQQARGNRELRATVNQGKPPIAATGRAGQFHEAVAAREAGAPYHPPANRGGGSQPRGGAENQPRGGAENQPRGGAENQPRGGAENQPRGGGNNPRPVHPSELPKFERPAPPNTGNANRDRKYQQQQDKMYAKQDQQRQQLQQRQEQEHQRMERQNASQAQRQQVEQRHQQQTEQLQQRHVQQQQHMQQRQQPPPNKQHR